MPALIPILMINRNAKKRPRRKKGTNLSESLQLKAHSQVRYIDNSFFRIGVSMDNKISRYLILLITAMFIMLGLPLTLFADVTGGTHEQTGTTPINIESLILERLQKSNYWKSAIRNPQTTSFISKKIIPYLVSMHLDPDSKAFENLIEEMAISSLQYINCESSNDWECLESQSPLQPNASWRRETSADLGTPIIVNQDFQAEIYFTNRWKTRVNPQIKIEQKTVADTLAEKIQTEAEESMYMALYGIDDIENSMRSVYEAIRSKILAGVKVLGVFDISGEGAPNSFLRNYNVNLDGSKVTTQEVQSLDYAFQVNPTNQNSVWAHPSWIRDLPRQISKTFTFEGPNRFLADIKWLMKSPERNNAIRLTFQYGNTLDLIRLMNQNIANSADTKARIEYPFQGIMHNKFIVFKNKNGLSLWSGTANVAQTCMGDENNSNTSLFIRNSELAQIFVDEFYEMYNPVQESTNKSVTQVSQEGSADNAQQYSGKFHNKKTPNTKRYLKFADGTEVRVYFSPTDDAEHRAIIPMLNSANTGDQVRIAMFGAGGLELVRSLQAAACRQVEIKIVLDRLTGSNNYGILKSEEGNIYEKNPYCDNPAPIGMHLAAWPEKGLNHNKVGTLTRKSETGYHPEVMIIGSQNWSQSGNDLNDENILVIRNRTRDLQIASKFNAEFDNYLYPLSEVQAAKSDSTGSPDEGQIKKTVRRQRKSH